MKRHRQDCPVAGMLNIFGDHWTLLIVREAFYGATRFSEFERNTSIAKNLLVGRLALLVDHDIFRKTDIGENGTRYAYVLTEKGRSLLPVMVAMYQWGNQYLYENGQSPIRLNDRQSGQAVSELRVEASDGRVLDLNDIIAVPGPHASDATRARLAQII